MGLLQYAIAFTFTASSSQLPRSWYPVTGLGGTKKLLHFVMIFSHRSGKVSSREDEKECGAAIDLD
jgi:hypothetical protein